MNCIKCKNEIPDGAKFCPVCGEKAAAVQEKHFCPECGMQLEIGTKFCPICGSAADDDAMQSATISQGYAENADIEEKESVPAYSAARPSDNVPSFSQPASTMPEVEFSNISAVKAVPLKTGKPWIGIIICAAAVALLAAGALIYLFNASAITNALMGDSGYAKMLEGNTLKTISEAAESPAAAAMLQSAGSSATEMAAVYNSYSGSSSFDDIMEGNYIDNYGSASSSSSSSLYDFNMLCGQINSSMLEYYGKSGAEISLDMEISLTDTIKELFAARGEDTEEFDKIIEMLNSTTFDYSVYSSKDAVSGDFRISDDKGFMIDARGFVLSDGTIAFMFPFSGEKCIKYTVDQSGIVSAQETPALDLDEKEFSRLVGEVIDIYLEHYSNAEISVQGDVEMTVSGVSVSGRLVTTTFDSEKLMAMFTEIINHIADDEYFSTTIIDFVNKNGGELTLEEYKESITDDFMPRLQSGDMLIVKTLADNSNNIIAKSYNLIAAEDAGMSDGGEDIELVYIETSKVFAAEFKENGVTAMSFRDDKISNTDGKAQLKFYNLDTYQVGINIMYADVKTVDFSGIEMITGSWEISIDVPASIIGGLGEEINSSIIPMMSTIGSSGTGGIETALSQLKVTLSNKIEGDTCAAAVGIDLPQYGSVMLNTRLKLVDTAPAALPAGAYDITNAVDGDEEAWKDAVSQFKAMIADAKRAAENMESTGSPYAEYLSELLAELEQKLDDSLVPKATAFQIYDLLDESQSVINDFLEIYYSANGVDLISDANEYNDLASNLISEINSARAEYGSEMPLDRYNDFSKQLEELKKAKEELQTRLEEERNASKTHDFSKMPIEEIIAVVQEAVYRYESIVISNSELIVSNNELREMTTDLSEMFVDYFESVERYSDKLDKGTIDVSILRRIRNQAQAFEEAVIMFENALAQTA